MTKGVCIFDLDNTLGDFRGIDYFGLIYEPKVISGFIEKKVDKDFVRSIIQNYSDEEYNFLEELRNKFEKKVHEKKLDEGIFRPELKEILNPLVQEYKKHRILGFIIYSNNGNLYSLEYAGRHIQHMFHAPKLFLKYLHRYEHLRDKYDGNSNGSRSKMVNTIKQIVPTLENKTMLFVDDLIHNDFYTAPDSTYILIPPYDNSISSKQLEDIWNVFEEVFYSFDEDKQKMFFGLYHVKKYLNIESLDEIKSQYLNYSKISKSAEVFHEDLPMIRKKINSYIMKLPKVGGFKRTRKAKLRKAKSVKYNEDNISY